eukprot:jgi/Botrbrau1/21008/Bobra.0144s0024.1
MSFFFKPSRGLPEFVPNSRLHVRPFQGCQQGINSLHVTTLRIRRSHWHGVICQNIQPDGNYGFKSVAHPALACGLAMTLWLFDPTQAIAFKYGDELLFQPLSYVGRWYEVSSLKKGFSGAGQSDCHCTQGIYTPRETDDPEGKIELTVNTFCAHGSPQGRVSGIQGAVTCANPVLLKLLPEFKSELDKGDEIVEKCVLRFPSLPFVPPQPYNIIRTDYTTYALVRGSADKSFIQIYSRTPNPGPEFIQVQKDTLAMLGYPVDEFH